LGVTGPCNETITEGYDNTTSPTGIITNHTSAFAYAGNAKITGGIQYANDTLTVPGGSGPIPNVQFALENNCLLRQNDDGSCLPSSAAVDLGIMGLSPYITTSIGNGGPTFRRNLYDAGLIASQTMVMWFDRHLGPLGQLVGGTLFGAIDKSKYTGPLVRVPNAIESNQVGLYVPKPVFSVAGQTFTTSQDTNCLVDSGSHADSIPFFWNSTDADVFYNATGFVDYAGIIRFNGTCESIPQDLTFDFTWVGVNASESITIQVPVRNYARGYVLQGVDLCLLNVNNGDCIFGAPFSSAALIAVDDADKSIAFAQGGVSEEGSLLDLDQLKVIGVGESYDSI
jgi:hypothetical protein